MHKDRAEKGKYPLASTRFLEFESFNAAVDEFYSKVPTIQTFKFKLIQSTPLILSYNHIFIPYSDLNLPATWTVKPQFEFVLNLFDRSRSKKMKAVHFERNRVHGTRLVLFPDAVSDV